MQLLSEAIAEDSLESELENFVGKMVQTIPLIPPSSPVLLSGDWGSGKSSVLHHFQTRLTPSHHVLQFHAWKYEQEDSLLSCLIRCLWESRQIEKKQESKLRNLFRVTLAATTAIGMRALPVFLGEGAQTLCKGLTLDKLVKEYETAKEITDFEPTASITDKLVSSFIELITGIFPDRDIIILIDDLDRCSPESSLVLLDSIRILVNGLSQIKPNRVRFVVAMDQITVTEMVANKFSSLNSYEANRYMEKLFPFVFKIPTMSDESLSQFVHKKMGDMKLDDTDHLYEMKEAVIEQLLDKSFRNPRLIKRCLNKICLFNRFFNGQELAPPVQSSIYLWMAATERWPTLRRLLLRKPFSFWSKMSDNIEKGEVSDDDEVNDLMAQKGFKEFFRQHMANDIKAAIKRLSEAEKEIARYGL
ncbi:P-loop NTPase fold protein [Pleionea sp. CnH1-48]|uniref:P-loop NTPase fold protein n=1 Tax=Pleionea sp. CnH1-48 TaxID=2954494 RepID=UPI002097BE51|nr:P-loop NTPase fold protein [Pleionea sp. CnH1-48]MCO7226088.1 KAP family NTPase [Pleionea sp. CnH1-48]